MNKYILAIDQGTTGTTVALVSNEAKLLHKVNFEYPQIYPQPGWVEHDPEQIWTSVLKGIEALFATSKVKAAEIAGIGITNQRETVVLWDRKTHRPLHNAIVWQCRRTSAQCEKMKKKGLGKTIKKKTGLVIDPYFSSTKAQWLLDHVSESRVRAQAGELALGTIDSFLLWRLSGGKSFKTDVSNASRTQLMNIHALDWDKDLLKLFKIPRALLADIVPSSGEFGRTYGVPGLPDGIPIAGIAGDQQAALFGQACFAPGDAKCTFGTGSFLLMNTGATPVASKAGMLTTVAWQLKGESKATYALEGGAFICGAAVQFLRDQMKFISKSSEVEILASSVEDSGGVEFVPALTGLGAPYWRAEARGVICGLTRGTTQAHIARATLEGMALQNVEILKAMEKDLGRKLKNLRVDGGAAADALLMQIQSDYLGSELTRPLVIETTVAGAAFLAGLGVGLWPNKEAIRTAWKVDRKFSPTLSKKAQAERLSCWRKAVAKA